MVTMKKKKSKNSATVAVGIVLMLASLFVLIGFGTWLVYRSNISGQSGAGSSAIIFIDVSGRIIFDGSLQVDGPAPVPVTVGEHTIAYASTIQEPQNVSVEAGQFLFVPSLPQPFPYDTKNNRGRVNVAAFPPDTTIEIPDCTPVDVSRTQTCKSKHTLGASLSPGAYTILYTNPNLGTYEETFTVTAGAVIERQYSYIETIAQWNAWRQQYGNVIEQHYPRYYRRSGVGGLFLLPFEATGEVFDAIF